MVLFTLALVVTALGVLVFAHYNPGAHDLTLRNYHLAGVPDWMPLAATVAIFTLAFAGLAYSLFPYVVIDRMTIREAAAHPSALKFMLVGVAIVFPFLIGYTVFAYRVFRGKARAGMYE